MRAAVLFASVALGVAVDMTDDPAWPHFAAFVEKYNRQYPSPGETAGRFEIFKDNLRRIAQRNARTTKAKHGVNKFADLTPEEFRAKYTGYRPHNSSWAKPKLFDATRTPMAASIDWREQGAVTPIKNQGQCGSCWAFSATEQLESDYFLKFKKLNVLAPQQIVSCDTMDLGCNGGNPVTAYQYVNQVGGQDSSSSYPYFSGVTGQSGTCKANSANFEEDVLKAFYVSQGASQESNMLLQIEESPMSVCVDAQLWQTYTSGIITSQSGCGQQLDHAVQAVGYNAEQNYWIVRNSWGTDWGNAGYIYVEYGSNVCGIADEVTIVTAQKPTKASVQI